MKVYDCNFIAELWQPVVPHGIAMWWLFDEEMLKRFLMKCSHTLYNKQSKNLNCTWYYNISNLLLCISIFPSLFWEIIKNSLNDS